MRKETNRHERGEDAMLERFIELMVSQSLPVGLVLLGTGLILLWFLDRVG